MKKLALILLTYVMTVLSAPCAETDGKSRSPYIPQIHGNIRAGYELSTEGDGSRFLVKNARIKIDGMALPVVDYRIQMDFCNRGKVRVMDAYLTVKPAGSLKVMLGQMRVPGSVEAHRDINEYIFTNTTYAGTDYGNLRNVGVKASYKTPTRIPFYVEGGIFNSYNMTDHSRWNSAMTYGILGRLELPKGWRPRFAFMSRLPEGGRRFNQYDASLTWSDNDHWLVEGEYVCRLYTGNAYRKSHAYTLMADYGFGVRSRLVQRLSFQGRFDGMTDLSNAIPGTDGKLLTDSPGRKRITVGATASYIHEKATLDFMINYQNVFDYDKVLLTEAGSLSKITMQMVLHF